MRTFLRPAVTSSSQTAAPAPSGAERPSRAASGGVYFDPQATSRRHFGFFDQSDAALCAEMVAAGEARRRLDALLMAVFFAASLVAAVLIGFGFAAGILSLPVIGG